MYRKHFGLSGLPFKITPDISVFYTQGAREDILSALIYTVTRGDGIIKVTGEVGCGKTMLLRLLASSLPDQFSIIYINSPNLSSKDMLLYICTELGLPVNSTMLKFELVNLLTNELLRLHGLGKRVVMLIDEAQAMTLDTLEEIRLLTNLETNEDKLLQIVLFGQPELDRALENVKVRQLKSRITYNIHIPPLTPTEVKSYLNYRMRKLDYEGLDLFDDQLAKAIHKISQGWPRSINVIADKLLMAAFSTGDDRILMKHLRSLDDLEGFDNRTFSSYMNSNKMLVVALSMLVLMLFAFIWFNVVNQNQISTKEILSSSTVSMASAVDDVEVEKEIEAVAIAKKLSHQAVMDLIDVQNLYKVSDANALLGDSVLLNNVLAYHAVGIEWLNSLPNDMNVIQLASPKLDALNATMEYYTRHNFSYEDLHILIDSSKSGKDFRLKVFFLSSPKYTELMDVIDQLPDKIKKSKPYVTTVKQLQRNLLLTAEQLKLHGIEYVGS